MLGGMSFVYDIVIVAGELTVFERGVEEADKTYNEVMFEERDDFWVFE